MGVNVGLPVAAIVLFLDASVLAYELNLTSMMLHAAAFFGVCGALQQEWSKEP